MHSGGIIQQATGYASLNLPASTFWGEHTTHAPQGIATDAS